MYTIPTTLQTALTNKTPQRVLIEFANKTFSNEKVAVSSGVELDETFQSADDFTVGGTPSAEIQFTLINENSELNNFAFGKFTAWLGARIDSGTPGSNAKTKTFTEGGVSRLYEFTPLGTFIAERPNVVNIKAISITANDQMQLFDVDMPSDNALNLTYPTSMGNLFAKMCNYLGVSYVSSTFTNSALSISSRPKAFGNATMRDVLGWIAEAAGCVARFNRNGKLAMTWFNTVNKTYTESNYSDFTPYWYETTAVNGLSVRNGSNEHVTGSGSNKYLIKDNPFLTGNNQSTYETAVYNKLNAAPTFHPASASLFENWNIEAGDVVTVQNEGTNYSVPMYNVHIRWTGDTKVDTESTGNKKRDALPEVEKKYYGGTGARTFADEQQNWYVAIADDVNSVRSELAVTASSIWAHVEDAECDIASLTVEANSIRAEVQNARSEYAAFVIEANQIRSRVGDAEDNITTLQQTSSTIRAWVEGAESRISELELTQSGLVVTVGKKNTTYRQWTDPQLNTPPVVLIPGDRWIKTKGLNKWNDVQTKAWSEVNDLPWKDAAGPEEYIWTGSEWRLINDYGSDVLLGAKFSVLDDRITGIVRDVDGRTSQIEQTANYIKSTVTDTKNGLSSMILQEASQIRTEVTDSVCGLQSSITQNADRIALVVNESNNTIKAAQIVAAINNSGSSVLISADKILLDGSTTVAGCLSVSGGTLYVDKLAWFNDNVTVASSKVLSTGKLRVVGSGSGEYYDLDGSKVKNFITELQVASSGNVYWLEKKTVYNSNEWTKIQNSDFNRGTTPVLSGAWSGATYTVTATGATPVSTNVMYKPAGDGQHTNFSVETYHDNLNVAGNKVLTEYVHLTEDVSAKYVYGRWGSSTGTAYARVSTAETYQAGYNAGANATVSISGSWNTSNATFTATALPGTNKTVSTQVFLVPDGDGQSNNFSVYTTHTAGNTSAVKLRTEHVYVTEDVTNKYAYARWASTTGTAFARVSTANTYNAGKNSVTLSESWDLPNGTYTVTASNSSTNKKSTQIFLVPDGNNQSNNFSVYATHTSGSASASKVRTNYVYATEDVNSKRVDVRWGSATGTPYAHVDTTNTFNAGKNSVTVDGSWAYDDTGVFTYSASNGCSTKSTTIHLSTKRMGAGNTSTDHFPIWVYNGGSTANKIIERSIYLTEEVSTARSNCRVLAHWNSADGDTYGRVFTPNIWDAGADSVSISSANWETITANNVCRHVELSNGKSNKSYIHVTASKAPGAEEEPSGYLDHFPLWVYYGSSESNVLITREVYLKESTTGKYVNARWNTSGGTIMARVSTEATYNSVTLSAAWSGNTYTVAPSNNKTPKSTTIGMTGDGENDSFTVSAYHDSSSANKVASMNGYLVVTTSSTRNDNKAEVRLIAKTGTTSLLVSSQTLGAVYDAGYSVTTGQIYGSNLHIGNGQDAGYSGSTNIGSLSKTNIQANAYVFFQISVHGTTKKYRITINP